ncbi:MAG: hypothetical protein JNL97_12470, partial [Verrucomicrobiales bacterium]|nr:hypothetical protein [Verrucomicrobiales bacterium]
MTNAPPSIPANASTEGLRDIADPVAVSSLAAELLFWGSLAAVAIAAAILAR